MAYVVLMVFTFLAILLLSDCRVDLKDDDDLDPCESLLESFAYATGNFTYCTIYYARPIRLCQLCKSTYLNVRTVYSDINNFDPTGGQMCKDKLFNLDRLQVVDSGFQFVANLWSRAKCDSCYQLDSKKEPAKLKPEVALMYNISDQFDDCVKKHKNESSDVVDPAVCDDCRKYYQRINNQYSVLKGPSGEEDICMDIVDLVNRTRLDWSTTLGCYVYKKKVELIYLIITGLVTLIPVAFYFFTWCLITKKQQLVALQSNVPDYLKQIHRRASNAIIGK